MILCRVVNALRNKTFFLILRLLVRLDLFKEGALKGRRVVVLLGLQSNLLRWVISIERALLPILTMIGYLERTWELKNR
jgi:hypothetical protein